MEIMLLVVLSQISSVHMIILVLIVGGRDYLYNPLERNICLVYKRYRLPIG